jgi:hypothetical protein
MLNDDGIYMPSGLRLADDTDGEYPVAWIEAFLDTIEGAARARPGRKGGAIMKRGRKQNPKCAPSLLQSSGWSTMAPAVTPQSGSG